MKYKEAYVLASDEIEAHYSKYRSDQYSIFRGQLGIKPEQALNDFKQCDFYAQLFLKRLDFYKFYKAPQYSFEAPQVHLPEHLRMMKDAIKILCFLDDLSHMTSQELRDIAPETGLDISTENLLLLQHEVVANLELITNHLEIFITYFHPAFALASVLLAHTPMYTIGGASDAESMSSCEEKEEQPAIIIDTQRDEQEEGEKASCWPCCFFGGKKEKKEEPLLSEKPIAPYNKGRLV